jgi:hypothetical protein
MRSRGRAYRYPAELRHGAATAMQPRRDRFRALIVTPQTFYQMRVRVDARQMLVFLLVSPVGSTFILHRYQRLIVRI